MRAIQHFSSSSGNLYEIVANNGKRLLLEAGVKWKKLLKAINFDLNNIEGLFATHLHFDHSVALKDCINAGIECYASIETFQEHGLYDARRTKCIKEKDLIRLKSFQVLCFALNHDCPGALGYVVRAVEENEYLLFAPDTAFLSQKFNYPFKIIMIECSYSKDILEDRVAKQTINETLAKRLLTSHLEVSETMRYLEQFCNLSRCEQIHLLHLSGENIDKREARNRIFNKFMIETIVKE